MLSSFKKSPVEQETIGCYSIFQVGSLSILLWLMVNFNLTYDQNPWINPSYPSEPLIQFAAQNFYV